MGWVGQRVIAFAVSSLSAFERNRIERRLLPRMGRAKLSSARALHLNLFEAVFLVDGVPCLSHRTRCNYIGKEPVHIEH